MTVGWYVHHHGAGHLHRLRCALPFLDDVTVLSSLETPSWSPCEWITLPDDRDSRPMDADAAGTLHWVPRRHAGLRERMSQISAWIARSRPDAMVVDVSVEVALLARLHGVPTVIVAQRGRRDDPPHRLAYQQAAAVAAPWTAAVHSAQDLPSAVRFVGAISRFDDRVFTPPRQGGDVLVLVGSGGHSIGASDIEAAAATSPGRLWHVAGPVSAAGPNVRVHGPDAPVGQLLDDAAVVVGSVGGNVIAEVAAARRAFVGIPQRRPFGEQVRHAQLLADRGLAICCERWPSPRAWPAVLDAAERHDPRRWDVLHDGGGAQRLAAVVHEVACA